MNDNRNKSNGKKRYPARSGKGSSYKREDVHKPGRDTDGSGKASIYTHPGNDFSWWNKYPELIDAASRVSFPYKPGMSIRDAQHYAIVTAAGVTKEEKTLSQRIPGIFAIDWVPSLGRSEKVTDPISIVAKELFSRVRSKFSGALAVDGPDMVMQIMAADSIFAYIAWLKRVYRTVNSISKQNYLFPEKVLAAMGFDEDAIVALKANRMQLYSNINLLIRYAQKIRCPKVFDVLERHSWMSEYLYADAPSDMCQIYMFNASAYYRFALVNSITDKGNEDDSFLAGGLELSYLNADVTHGSDVVTKLFNFGHDLITALTEWEDMYIINGYFERAFEGVPNFSPTLLGEDEIITTSYDTDVLSQIENSTTVPTAFFGVHSLGGGTLIDTTVMQQPSTNAIFSRPKAVVHHEGMVIPGNNVDTYLHYGNIGKTLLSLRQDNPEVKDIVEATRLHIVADPAVKIGDYFVYDIHCGTEIILQYRMSEVNAINNYASNSLGTHLAVVNTQYADRSYTRLLPAAISMSAFDWHPIVYSLHLEYLPDTDTFTVVNYLVHGDIHNMTTVDNNLMSTMHFNCLLSAFSAFGL